MDAQVLKVVGAVAGIGGIALALFFWLFRDIIRKNIFPRLTKDQAYKTIRLLMVLATIVALAGIASWAFAGPREGGTTGASKQRVLTVQLTEIGFDTLGPGNVLDGGDIPGGSGGSISDQGLDEAAEKVSAWLTARGELSPHETVRVTITPSDNPAKPPRIDVTPPVAWTAYSVVTDGNNPKVIKEMLTSSSGSGGAWKIPTMPWSLQIDPKGHRLVTVDGTVLAAHSEDSKRIPVALAFEDRTGSLELVADRITQRFHGDARFRLTDPRSLEALRQRIRSLPPLDPLEQNSVRERLGFEYFVACSVRLK